MKLIKELKSVTLILSIISTSLLYAQEDSSLGPLITDRPDATESPTAIPKGFLQFETGAFYESFEENNIKTEDFTYNTMLVRYGLLDNFELRLGYNFTDSKTKFNGTEITSATSFSPLLLGFKTTIVEENGVIPEIGFLGHLNLPFLVNNDIRPENTGVDFRFSFAHTLNENSSLSYNLGAAWENDSSEAAYIYSLAYGHSLTNKLGAYIEVYGDAPENKKANHLWDVGFTYLVSNNFQLDATVGSSITKGQDILISAGFSFRIPKS
ncbi:MAG: transporter [Lacinutrix sp.]|uniref:transporter n=1 Tax=Lacinutrix sp. TaxID=1937692 RepID=UPI0030A5A047